MQQERDPNTVSRLKNVGIRGNVSEDLHARGHPEEFFDNS